MRVGELFAGIGGFGLGLERAGMRVVWQSEIEPYACAVLRRHWPLVPNCGDIRAIRAATVAPIDVLCGGFPCQDISHAGKRSGIDGPQSGLWREFARLVRELRPRWIIAENVAALRTRGYDRVADDLETAGYAVWPFVVGADDLGAPHRRKRVWIVAYAARAAEDIAGGWLSGAGRRPNRGPGIAADADRNGRELERCSGLCDDERAAQRHDIDGCTGTGVFTDTDSTRLAQRQSECSDPCEKRAPAIGDHRWDWDRAPEPTICRVDDGISARLHTNRRQRLAALGNSLVPQIAEAIGRAIMRVESGMGKLP